jgi:hypothetical protein
MRSTRRCISAAARRDKSAALSGVHPTQDDQMRYAVRQSFGFPRACRIKTSPN